MLKHLENLLILASPFPALFLDIYSLSISSLVCKALRIVIKFLVLRSIYLNSSHVNLKNGILIG